MLQIGEFYQLKEPWGTQGCKTAAAQTHSEGHKNT